MDVLTIKRNIVSFNKRMGFQCLTIIEFQREREMNTLVLTHKKRRFHFTKKRISQVRSIHGERILIDLVFLSSLNWRYFHKKIII